MNNWVLVVNDDVSNLKMANSMLRNFHTTSEAKQTEIASFHRAGNWENYTIKVHALKSSARTIGAMELSSCAAGLEQAGKSGDMAYLEESPQINVTL